MGYFHPEDELFSRNSEYLSFPFKSHRSEEEQNLKTSGLLLLVSKLDFEAAIGDMGSFLESDV
jgi:hypothetical protein